MSVIDRWWRRRDRETEQEWANRIEAHNVSEADEVRLANMRARDARAKLEGRSKS